MCFEKMEYILRKYPNEALKKNYTTSQENHCPQCSDWLWRCICDVTCITLQYRENGTWHIVAGYDVVKSFQGVDIVEHLDKFILFWCQFMLGNHMSKMFFFRTQFLDQVIFKMGSMGFLNWEISV